MTRVDIINEARSWVDTPWHHQGRVKGVGVDCVGLLVGVGRALGLEIEDDPRYREQPIAGELRKALLAHLTEIDALEAIPGDVLLFDYLSQGGESHVAIMTSPDFMVHAYRPMGHVAETRIGEKWRNRLSGAFVVPGLSHG